MKNIKKVLLVIGGLIILVIVLVSILSSTSKTEEEKTEITTTTNETIIALTEPATSSADNKVVSGSSEVKTTQSTKTTSTPTTQTNPKYRYYSVTSIVDGDTIKINIDGTIETFRLIGIDTPETVDPRKEVQCFGKESSDKAKELLFDKKVRIETDSTQGTYDKYNRLLAYIYRDDGLFYNKYMVEQGYAHEYTYNTPYKYQAEFKAAQKSAQTNLIGLWSPNTCNGSTTVSNTSEQQTISPTTTQPDFKFYTSSYGTAKYYYPASCSGWKSLSPKYLKGFYVLGDLLKAYSRTESPSC